MNEYMMRMLREDGVNGLKLIPRIPNRPQDRTDKTITLDVLENHGKLKIDPIIGLTRWVDRIDGDSRRYADTGYPAEDYCIDRGDGSPLLVIREVQTPVEGMKKYALIDLPVKPTPKLATRIIKHLLGIKETKKEKREALRPVTYQVRYVYSEGIELEKMATDKDYAKAVIGLLSQRRLTDKADMSYRQMTKDIVYIGTIGQTDNGYEKVGIKDYIVAISKIDSQLKELARKQEELNERNQSKERRKERELYMRIETRDYDEQDWKIMIKRMIATCGEETAERLFIEAKKEEQENPTPRQGETIYIDGEGEYYGK